MKAIILITLSISLSCCILSKGERQDRKANRKLEKLIDKYPKLVTKDTLIDTVKVIVPEIRIDTVLNMSKDVSGVDSILTSFENKLDSLTRIQLGDEIKYYITNRQVIEDTITYEEDGVTVKVWQEEGLIRIQLYKPESEIIEVVTNVVDNIKPISIPWYKQLLVIINKYAISIGILLFIIWLFLKGLKILKNKL